MAVFKHGSMALELRVPLANASPVQLQNLQS